VPWGAAHPQQLGEAVAVGGVLDNAHLERLAVLIPQLGVSALVLLPLLDRLLVCQMLESLLVEIGG